MKRLLAVLLLGAAAAAVAPAVGTAGLVRVHGSFAGAALSVTTPDGCRYSAVSFAAIDETSHAPGGPGGTSSRLDVYHEVYDRCSDAVLFTGYGTLELAPEAFAISTRGDSARLTATVGLVDASTQETRPVSFDVVWQAVASPWLEQSSRYRTREVGMFVLALDTSELSDAVLLGSVSAGSTELMDGEISSAQLGSARSGVLVVPSLLASSSQLEAVAATRPTSQAYTSTWAVAIWEGFDETGCIRRLGIVVGERASIDRADPVTSGFVDFSRWNHCTNEPELWVTNGFSQLPDGVLAVQPSLAGARLSGAIAAIDGVTGLPVALGVDVTWTGTGAVNRSGGRSSSTQHGVTQTNHDASRWRSATVDGSIAGPVGNLLAGYPVGPADLVGGAFGQVRSIARTRP